MNYWLKLLRTAIICFKIVIIYNYNNIFIIIKYKKFIILIIMLVPNKKIVWYPILFKHDINF